MTNRPADNPKPNLRALIGEGIGYGLGVAFWQAVAVLLAILGPLLLLRLLGAML